ncbi:hypothetical protein CXB51_000707 [Gossypium anomalum]|uniref:Small ribosomal subunit protein uS10 domain-containing protein n=1 Tax=Gossypium anomalum TaxID=47600 RepID=A0A8J6DCX0_9ROSI|nr:hypothetical protein CXB51_000707 [Gossypium anomalum]
MAVSSISSTLIPSLPIQNASSPKVKFTFLSHSPPLSFNHLKLCNNSQLSQSPTKLFASPEALEDTPEVGVSEVPSSSYVAEADKVILGPLIEDSCKQIIDAARTTNAKTMGPVPLPTKKRIYCVLKSPHVHKDARFHFEIRTHQRLIDILYPTAQTIDSLMQLDLPAGVDVEVKL